MVRGSPVPLRANAFAPREVAGACKVVNSCGRRALPVVGGRVVLDWSDLVSVKKFNEGGRNLFPTLTRWVELTVPVTTEICGVFYAGELRV